MNRYKRGLAIAMMALGGLAILLPVGLGSTATVLLGWILVLTGGTHMMSAFHPTSGDAKRWRAYVGFVYLLGGFLVALRPGMGLLGLTIVTASILITQGGLLVLAFVRLGTTTRRVWILADALAALALGFLIGFLWPASSVQAIGTLLGTNLLMSGFVLLLDAAGRRSEPSRGFAVARSEPGPA